MSADHTEKDSKSETAHATTNGVHAAAHAHAHVPAESPSHGGRLAKEASAIRLLKEEEHTTHKDFVEVFDGKVVESPHPEAYTQLLESSGFKAPKPKSAAPPTAEKDDDEATFGVEEPHSQQLFAGKTDRKPALISFGREAFVGKNSVSEEKRNEKEQQTERSMAELCSREKRLNNPKEVDALCIEGLNQISAGKSWAGQELTTAGASVPPLSPPNAIAAAAAPAPTPAAVVAANGGAGPVPPSKSKPNGAANGVAAPADVKVEVKDMRPDKVIAESTVNHNQNPLCGELYSNLTRALFLDAAYRLNHRADADLSPRSVVSLAPRTGDAVDFKAPPLFDFVNKAMPVAALKSAETSFVYRTSMEANLRALKQTYKLRLDALDRNAYYNEASFAAGESGAPAPAAGAAAVPAGSAYQNWLKIQTSVLNELLLSTNSRIEKLAAARAAETARDIAAGRVPSPAAVPAADALPHYAGPKPKKYKPFPMCCVQMEEEDEATPVVPAAAAAAAGAAKPAAGGPKPDAKSPASASGPVSADDHKTHGILAGSLPDLTHNFHSQYKLLLNVLYQHESRTAAAAAAAAVGVGDAKDPAFAAAAAAAMAALNPMNLFPVYTMGAGVNTQLRPLSVLSKRILKSFGQMYGVPPVYRAICDLELLTRNVAITREWFALTHNAIVRVLKLQKKPQYSHWWISAERNTFHSLCSNVVQWTSKLMSRYQLVFFKRTPDLCECLVLLKRAWGVWTAGVSASVVPRAPNLGKHLEPILSSAIEHQYAAIVSLTSTAAATFAVSGKAGEYAGGYRLVGHVTDCLQLMQVLKCVTDEVTADSEICDSESFPEIGDAWSLVQVTADRYWGLAWPDATIFLRKLQAEEDTKIAEAELNRVFSVLAGMRLFYTALNRINQLPEVGLQDLFRPFIDIWLTRTRKKFSELYLVDITTNDTYERLGSDLFSSSVVDLFSLLYPLCRLFRKMPFTQKHVQVFAQLLTSIVLGYVKIVSGSIDKQLSAEAAKAEAWGYTPDPVTQKLKLSLPATLLVRMNNVWVCKKMLSALLESAKLESAYVEAGAAAGADGPSTARRNSSSSAGSAAPSVSNGPAVSTHSSSSANLFQKMKSEEPADPEDLDIPEAVANQLGCTEGFKSIQDNVELVAFRISRGIYPFCEKQLIDLVFGKQFKPDALFDEAKVHSLLEPMWDYLYKHFNNFTASCYDAFVHKIIYFLLERVCRVLESMLAWGANREEHTSLPRKEQIVRIGCAFNLCLYFFNKIFGWQKLYEKKLGEGAMGSFKFLLDLVKGPAHDMIEEWNKFPIAAAAQEELLEKAGFDIREKARMKGRPWISRKQLAWYIVLRKERDDDSSKEVKDFCKANTPKKKGFFDKIFG